MTEWIKFLELHMQTCITQESTLGWWIQLLSYNVEIPWNIFSDYNFNNKQLLRIYRQCKGQRH